MKNGLIISKKVYHLFLNSLLENIKRAALKREDKILAARSSTIEVVKKRR